MGNEPGALAGRNTQPGMNFGYKNKTCESLAFCAGPPTAPSPDGSDAPASNKASLRRCALAATSCTSGAPTPHMAERTEFLALATLALAWAATLSASCLLVSIAPLAAIDLGVSRALAPFTCGSFLLGCALVSAPSASLFTRLGRRGGFLVGAVAGMLGGTLGLVGSIFKVRGSAFIFAASALVGLAQGLGQFYRFAALEVSHPSRKPFALTLVLSGGMIAAFVGPQLAIATQGVLPTGDGGGNSSGNSSGTNSSGTNSSGTNSSAGGGGGGAEEEERFAGAFAAIVALHLLNALLSLAVCLPDGQSPGGDGGGGDGGVGATSSGGGGGGGGGGGSGHHACAAGPSATPRMRSTREPLLDSPAPVGGTPPAPVGGTRGSGSGGGGGGSGGGGSGGSSGSGGVSGGGGGWEEQAAKQLQDGSGAAVHTSLLGGGRLPLLRLMITPRILAPVLIAALAQSAMVVLMSPLALAMSDQGLSPSLRTRCYELHFFCMYAPGLLTSQLVRCLGATTTSALGALAFGGACAILATGFSAAHFFGGMGLCGVGWNLCFSSATLLLDGALPSPADALRVEAANDFAVFLLSALGSLGSGYVYVEYGWRWLVLGAGSLASCLMLVLLVRLCCCASRDGGGGGAGGGGGGVVGGGGVGGLGGGGGVPGRGGDAYASRLALAGGSSPYGSPYGCHAGPTHRRSNSGVAASGSGQYYAASALLGAAPLEVVNNHFRCDPVPGHAPGHAPGLAPGLAPCVSEAARREDEQSGLNNPLASPDAVRDYALAD